MLELIVPIVAVQPLADGWQQIVVAAPGLARGAQPGQFVLLNAAPSGTHDPLVPLAVSYAGINRRDGTVTVLVPNPSRQGFAYRPGDQLRLLGSLGHGWSVGARVRQVLLVGTVATCGPLLALLDDLLERRLAVTLLLGAEIGPGLPAHVIPADVEYHLGRGRDPVAAVSDLLDDAMLRWADAIYITLPPTTWSMLGQRLEHTRIRWERGLAFCAVALSGPCGVGVCNACTLLVGDRFRLACTEGPIFDLWDLART